MLQKRSLIRPCRAWDGGAAAPRIEMNKDLPPPIAANPLMRYDEDDDDDIHPATSRTTSPRRRFHVVLRRDVISRAKQDKLRRVAQQLYEKETETTKKGTKQATGLPELSWDQVHNWLGEYGHPQSKEQPTTMPHQTNEETTLTTAWWQATLLARQRVSDAYAKAFAQVPALAIPDAIQRHQNHIAFEQQLQAAIDRASTAYGMFVSHKPRRGEWRARSGYKRQRRA